MYLNQTQLVNNIIRIASVMGGSTTVSSTWQAPKQRCELCHHYLFIDSGYGNCKRYPPKLQLTKNTIFKKEYATLYPEVKRCEFACGEFKNKE